jgi:hypothetical protein
MGLEELVGQRILITAAQMGATPNDALYENLQQYCRRNDAQLWIIPLPGTKKDAVLHPSFQENPNIRVVDDDCTINKNLHIKNFYINPQQIDPTTGLGRFINYDHSAIVGSPKQRLKVIANSVKDLPKALITTGIVTEPDYRDNRQGKIAGFDHQYGAVVVELADKNMFHFRHIRALNNGSFTDLGKEYCDNKPTSVRPEAVVLGDIHSGSQDPILWKATMKFLTTYKPRRCVIHDLFDGVSISHHTELKPLKRATNASNDGLYKELEGCVQTLKDLYKATSGKTELVVVKSNHDEHLNRYLEEGRFATDPLNLKLSAQLAVAYLNGKDPLKEGLKLIDPQIVSKCTWVSRDDDYKVLGWQLGCHGDLGSNGSKPTLLQLEQSVGKCIIGHSHTPGILRNVYQVGTSTKLKMDYNRGPSSWLHTHALLYPDAQVQLVNFIDGKYTSSKA